MVRRCNSPLAADSLLFSKGCDCKCESEEYDWDITPANKGQTAYTIWYKMDSRFLEVHVYDVLGAREVYPAVTYIAKGLLMVSFAAAPAVGRRFKIVIINNGNE